MVAETKRQPRRIGPQAVATAPAPTEDSTEAEFSLDTFLADLSAGDLMDLDEASGGAVARMTGGEDVPVTLKLLFAVAWIVKRRDEPRLTFVAVRRMNPAELGDVLNSLVVPTGPKADSAPA